jgi:hypothetical protein
VGSLNHSGMLFLISSNDIITPGISEFIEHHLPLAAVHMLRPGRHGDWPMKHLTDCLSIMDAWLNVGDISTK